MPATDRHKFHNFSFSKYESGLNRIDIEKETGTSE